MLRKLLKHEFRATGRIMLPLYLILLATALGSNLSARWMLDSRHLILSILGGLLVTAFAAAILAAFVVAFILMIQRFYKNLLQDEGYLMFTLPVSVHQHIWSKLIVSAVWFVATVLAVIAAAMIVAYDVGFLRGLFAFLKDLFHWLHTIRIGEVLNGTVLFVEFSVLVFLGLMAFSLQFYAALAAGFSRPGHKMAWSVALFFLFQFAVQFGGSLLFSGADRAGFFDLALFHIDVGPAALLHLGMLLMIGLVILYGAIFYIVTAFFLKRRLSLE